MIQRNLYTQTAQKTHTPKILHAETLPRAAFTEQNLFPHRSVTHRRSYAQHFLHTDAFIHRCFYTENELHTETCAHRALLHTTSFHTKRFCSPFLITCLSCSPSQVYFSMSDVVTERDIAMVEVLVIYTVAIVSGMFRGGVLLFLLMQPVLIGF